MEPHKLFGRNGFINSDFFTPVVYLAQSFWPMALAALSADSRYLVRGNPWRILALPFSSQVAVIHVAVIAMPFLTLLSWIFFRESYQPVTMIILLALFYFFPRREAVGATPGQYSAGPDM
jgi:hypothetical protein